MWNDKQDKCIKLVMCKMVKTQVFLASINERDQKKFHLTMVNPISSKVENFSQIIKHTKGINEIYVWGFPSTEKNTIVWKQISEGDWFLFHFDGKYSYAGKVLKKLSNQQLANKIWKLDKDLTNMALVIFFHNVIKISLGFLKTNRLFGISPFIPKMHKILFLQAEQSQVDKILEKYGSIENFLGISSKAFKRKGEGKIQIIPDDFKEPPAKYYAHTIRFIRDTEKSQNLKKIYDNRCQICNFTFQIQNSEKYSEVHHVWPLGEGGIDDYNNMVVLCPNHHAEFDYGVIGFDSENNEKIVDTNGKLVGKISFHSGHSLKQENIIYHVKRMMMYSNDS